MIKVLIFLSVLLFFCCNTNRVNELQFSYSTHLKNVEKLKSARLLYLNEDYNDAINMYLEVECIDLMCMSKNISLAKAYMQLRDEESAMEYLNIAIKQGYDLYYLDEKLFSDFIDDIDNNKDSLENFYEEKINIPLRKQLNSMIKLDQKVRDNYLSDSIIEMSDLRNLVTLDSIVDIYGWPSLNIIGKPTVTEWINPSIIIVHSGVDVNWRYLEIILDECIKGNENWFIAEEIFNNILFRHSNESNSISVPYLEFENENLDTINSQFILNTIAQSLVRNKTYCIVFKVSSSNINIKRSLSKYLLGRGVRKDQLSFFKLDRKESQNQKNKISAFVKKIHNNSF